MRLIALALQQNNCYKNYRRLAPKPTTQTTTMRMYVIQTLCIAKNRSYRFVVSRHWLPINCFDPTKMRIQPIPPYDRRTVLEIDFLVFVVRDCVDCENGSASGSYGKCVGHWQFRKLFIGPKSFSKLRICCSLLLPVWLQPLKRCTNGFAMSTTLTDRLLVFDH